MHNKPHTISNNKAAFENIISWIFGIIVFTIGVLNLCLVHPVPGIVFILLSFVFFPQINILVRKYFSITIAFVVKIILGLIIIWFTLGISDLGDMMDDFMN
jgi:hypothetical protein